MINFRPVTTHLVPKMASWGQHQHQYKLLTFSPLLFHWFPSHYVLLLGLAPPPEYIGFSFTQSEITNSYINNPFFPPRTENYHKNQMVWYGFHIGPFIIANNYIIKFNHCICVMDEVYFQQPVSTFGNFWNQLSWTKWNCIYTYPYIKFWIRMVETEYFVKKPNNYTRYEYFCHLGKFCRHGLPV